jgi:hypothetical protein
MKPGYRFVAGRCFQVPAGTGGRPLGIEPKWPRSAAVQARCSGGAACGHDLRHEAGRPGQPVRATGAGKVAGPAYGMAVSDAALAPCR